MHAEKAKIVETSLRQSGLTGFDPAAIIAIIKTLLALFGVCPPVVAARRMRAFGRGQWYAGCNLDLRSLHRTIESSGVLTGDGDNPATVEDVAAAVKDVAGGITAAEVTAAFAEQAPA